MDFKLLILGTGSATPMLTRSASAQLVKFEQEYFLIDCGENTQFQLLKYKAKTHKIKHIFISHLHGDHYFGLIALLSSMNLAQRIESLTIYGPKGLKDILLAQFKTSDTRLGFALNFVLVNTQIHQTIAQIGAVTIKSIPLKHRILCSGFLFEYKKETVKFKKKSNMEGLSTSQIDFLKNHSKDSELTQEQKNLVEQYIDGFQLKTKSFAYCSDTAYFEEIIPFIKNVDLLYHEATFIQDNLERATKTNHSTAIQAATIALNASVNHLVIGHFSARYKSSEQHLIEAKTIFENTILADEGLEILF